MPWLLRLAHIRAKVQGGDSNEALRDNARGILLWKAALERGLLPDDETLKQLSADPDLPICGRDIGELSWPGEPLRFALIRSLSTLGVSRFCEKYPAVLATLQRSLLELVCKYQKQVLGMVVFPCRS
ncbi:hypothetical protein WJX75_006780 [Coccomyxa subellipsoidea]|uniref:Uncharacterized protein n=1 Tax=Coccomyxa subellipsoidea TaxID=248742 RepID=A0ABR2Z0G3_9CHLO